MKRFHFLCSLDSDRREAEITAVLGEGSTPAQRPPAGYLQSGASSGYSPRAAWVAISLRTGLRGSYRCAGSFSAVLGAAVLSQAEAEESSSLIDRVPIAGLNAKYVSDLQSVD